MSIPFNEPHDRIRSCELATSLRIPLVDSIYPAENYVVCVAVGDSDLSGLIPTDDELRLIRTYLDFTLDWYGEGYIRQLAERPFDIISGGTTMILAKRGEGDWCYRIIAWDRGPVILTNFHDSHKRNLAELFNSREDHRSWWLAWQAAHPA